MSGTLLKVGIVGLPNSGKSTLFNALLQRQIADVAEYPFTTIEPNVGAVQVPDKRLEAISKATGITKIVPAAIEFIDIAGLIKGAHKGEGLGSQFLGHIREADAILHLIRGFHNPNVPGDLNPNEDIKTIEEELAQGGIEKPAIYVVNVDETDLKNSEVPLTGALKISAKLENELSELSGEEQKAYLKELGVEQTGLEKIIRLCYELLNLITFFTIAGGKQIQAWPVKIGTKAIDAAKAVHTDMQKGFIKAKVVGWQDLTALGSWTKAKEKGLIRLEGKDYEIKDGDVVKFEFSA